ncbi:nucleoside monophosphate kinase [Candidatus Microgenomates bacterium]|nr:nucleoside monophosphate kinase [Candidatus Microgenomates bacterium]
MTKILFVGPQGSGKSTQARLLAQFLHLPYISTGDIFRRLRQENSEEGRAIKQILDSGELVDDQITAELVKKGLKDIDVQNGFIMDGYPRTLEQIKFFDPGFDKVFYLKLSDEEALKRLLKRGREDDTEDLIAERLRIYHEQTDPILDFYQKKGTLITIDGEGIIEQIQDRIRRVIGGQE